MSTDYDDIIFVITPKSPNTCKVCGKEYEEATFYKYGRDICKRCFSKVANFCRVRKVLLRAFKQLNVDKDTAIKILVKERNKIYMKLPGNRNEQIVVI
jgi:recombinational DNA repair protein (RecF pathway)